MSANSASPLLTPPHYVVIDPFQGAGIDVLDAVQFWNSQLVACQRRNLIHHRRAGKPIAEETSASLLTLGMTNTSFALLSLTRNLTGKYLLCHRSALLLKHIPVLADGVLVVTDDILDSIFV